MNWFYAQNGRQAGPVDDTEFDRLAAAGDIRADTLVWHSGLSNWQPYSQVRPVPAAPAAQSPSLYQAPGFGGGTSSATLSKAANPLAAAFPSDQVYCSECRQSFPPDEVVRIEGLYACARCKPILLQKLREGVRPTGASFLYAGFWIRALALLVDGVLMFIVNMVVAFALNLILPQARELDAAGIAGLVLRMGFSLLVPLSYEAILIARKGATLGMMACGLKVIRPDGSPLTLGRSIGRYFAKFLSGLTLCVGYLMAAADAQKRALHDHIADTRVIRKEAPAA